jgi:dynein light chain LC8-type
MDPASEELERRSRYLSSLIRRTKLTAAPTPAPLPPTPSPEPETKLELELERDRSPVRRAKLSPAPAPAPPPSTPHPEPETKLELEPRSRKLADAKAVVEKREVQDGDEKGKAKGKEERKVSVRVRAADMPVALQRRAVRLAYDAVAATPRVDGKRLALALKKVQLLPSRWNGLLFFLCLRQAH